MVADFLSHHLCFIADNFLECYAEPESDIIEPALGVAHDIAFVGGIAVVYCHVQSQSVWPWIPVEANLGRHIEAPSVLFFQEDVIVIIELGVASAQFHAYIGLEIGLNKAVAYERSKRQGKHLVLLVAIH